MRGIKFSSKSANSGPSAEDARERVRQALARDNPELAAEEFPDPERARERRNRDLADTGDAFARIDLTEDELVKARLMIAKRVFPKLIRSRRG